MRGHLIRNLNKKLDSNNKISIDLSIFSNKLSSLDIDREITNFNYLTISNYYPKTDDDILIILSEENIRKVIIISSQTILLTTKNTDLFDKLIFPELLNLYISNNKKESFIEQKEENNYIINDNLYILNFNNKFLELHINYFNNLKEKEYYKLYISKDYQKEEKEEFPTENNINYSYGYVNVLFIAVIITLLTVIICLINY